METRDGEASGLPLLTSRPGHYRSVGTPNHWSASSGGRAKFNSLVIGAFALMGLMLASAGVFGVTSYTVGRRTREFGLRVALGTQPVQVRRLVLRNAGLMAMAGIGVGLLTALMLSGSLSDLLFEVEAVAGATYGGVAVLLAGAVFLASYVPARRATKVDPMSVLRGD